MLESLCLMECWGVQYVLFVFFFQAEDGIRDLVRSRGLGDVYKRQDLSGALYYFQQSPGFAFGNWARFSNSHRISDTTPVSYTHLTLPTSDLV